MVLAQPCPRGVALESDQFEQAMHQAELDATAEGLTGPRLTPFLLTRLAEHTQGKSLVANRSLILNNVCLASQIAIELLEHAPLSHA